MMNRTSIRFSILLRSVRVLLTVIALMSVCTLPAASAGEFPAPAARYASTVSNRVQTLTLSVPTSSGEVRTQSEEENGIFYTTDGSNPVAGSGSTMPYTGEIRINRSMTVKYCAYTDGEQSEVGTLRFVYLSPVSLSELSCKGNRPCCIALRWKSNRDADGYRVYRRKKGASKWEKIAQIRGGSQTRYNDTSVTANATYSYCVTSYKGKVESLKSGCVKNVKAKHTHHYKTETVNCADGKRTLKCQDCGDTKKEHVKKGHCVQKRKEGHYTVEKCKNCGKVCKKYLSKAIPEYWNESIADALDEADERSGLPGYVFLTDPHWEKNAQNSPAIVNYVTREMGYSFAVCGGDVVAGFHSTKKAAVKEISSFYDKFTVPVLSVAGNHDFNSNCNADESAWLSESDLSRLVYSHNPASTHMTLGGSVGWCDDTKNKVRYLTFYFDETADVSPEIVRSIDEKVCELNEDWAVVLFSHAYWHYKRPGNEPSAEDEGKRLAAALLGIQEHSRANIVLWHVGHIHRDKAETISDKHGTELLVVSSNCDTCKKSTPWGGLTMRSGTDTEQVVDIVQLDKANGRVYMTRIGAGRSRSFRFRQKG